MDYIKSYIDFIRKFLKPFDSAQGKPLKVVFDCFNGTAGIILKELFNKTDKIEPILINDRPDGNFPAHGPNPLAKGALKDLGDTVLKNKADLGVAFDADGDRAFFVDDRGRPVLPDLAAALISKNFQGPIVLDLLAGYSARELLEAEGKKIIESRVGSYFIKKLMKKKNVHFGAEASGHYYFRLEGAVFDSGILAAIHLINEISSLKVNKIKYYRSGELNFRVRDKQGAIKSIEKKYRGEAKIISHLDGIKMEFDSPRSGAWWFNLRPSNTEDLVRLNLEAKNKKNFLRQLAKLKKEFKTEYRAEFVLSS